MNTSALKYLIGMLSILLSIHTATQAQQISISQGLDETVTSDNGVIEVTKYGKVPIWLVIQFQEKDLIEARKMYLFVDKRTETHDFVEFDTHKIEVSDSTTRIYKRLAFDHLGDYIISFTDADKKVIVSDTLRIQGRNKVYFCKTVEKGEPIDIRHQYWATSTGLFYYKVVVEGEESFGTHQFKINIYQHDGEGFNILIGNYEEYVYYNRNKMHYRGPSLDPGKYKVEVFKFNGEPYATNYLHLLEAKPSPKEGEN